MTHPLCGAEIGTLRRVFRDGGRTNSKLRARGIRASVLAWPAATTLEGIRVGKHLPALSEIPPSVFIPCHWRSGTDLVGLPFARLDREPMTALEGIYSALNLDGFEAAAPRFRGYLDEVKGYRMNAFPRDAATPEKVSATMEPWIAKWGCERDAPAEDAR